MGEIVTTIFESVGGVITGIVGSIKDAASELIYKDPAATTKEFSDIFQFGLTFLGISIATGIAYTVFRLIRRR